jgi:hypothetical protein
MHDRGSLFEINCLRHIVFEIQCMAFLAFGRLERFYWRTSCLITNTWACLKVHKIENFFGSEFEVFTISLLFLLKY